MCKKARYGEDTVSQDEEGVPLIVALRGFGR